MKKIVLLILHCSTVIYYGCDNEPATPTNSAPVIEKVTATSQELKVNEITSIFCLANDADGDDLKYLWTAVEGSFPIGSTGSSINWKAPNKSGSFIVRVRVSDETSDALKEIIINVTNNSGEKNAIIEGKVFKINTNTIISGVVVEAGGKSATSDQDGNYTIENLISGEVIVTARKMDYQDYEQTVTIIANQSIEHQIYLAGLSSSCSGVDTVGHDGKTYNTVQIGNQCWLKENLDVGTLIVRTSTNDIQTNNDIIEKFCFDNDEKNCNTYGGLYQWDEAMQYVTTEGSQGLCPVGWHIPTKSDFEVLINSVGGSANALKALGQGNGVNASGFSALLAGHRDHNDGLSHALGDDTIFWGSSESGSEGNSIDLYANSNSIIMNTYHKEHGFSVRCIKD